MLSYLNDNEIFPILELIRREIRKNNFDNNRQWNGGNEEVAFDPEDIKSITPLRGGSLYDPELINAVIVEYADGSLETTTLFRGVDPPVPETVPDYQYINNAMITGFKIESTSMLSAGTMTCKLIRENGYGAITKLEFEYT